jgi:HSP20 family protein
MARNQRGFGEMLLSAARSYQRPVWQPAVDAYQTERGWLLKYELAGVSPDQVEVLLSDRSITVRGERRDVRLAGGGQSYCMEISYNRFERTLELPCEVKTMDLATQYRDGMLFVQLTCRENK